MTELIITLLVLGIVCLIFAAFTFAWNKVHDALVAWLGTLTWKRREDPYATLAHTEADDVYIPKLVCSRCGAIDPEPQEDCIDGKEIEGAGTEPHVFE
jgi:hypothetical protein